MILDVEAICCKAVASRMLLSPIVSLFQAGVKQNSVYTFEAYIIPSVSLDRHATGALRRPPHG